jgi:hypothetical protein
MALVELYEAVGPSAVSGNGVAVMSVHPIIVVVDLQLAGVAPFQPHVVRGAGWVQLATA